MKKIGSFLSHPFDIQPDGNLSKKQYVLISLIPAILILISEFMLRKTNYPYTPGVGMKKIWEYYLLPGAILPILAGFLIGIFSRCSKGEKLEGLFSLPTIIANLLVYSIMPFFDPEVIPESDFMVSMSIQTCMTLFFFIPFSIIAGILAALMMTLGARLRRKISPR